MFYNDDPMISVCKCYLYDKFVDRIDNTIPRVTTWHHEDPRDRFVYPIHKRMWDSFS